MIISRESIRRAGFVYHTGELTQLNHQRQVTRWLAGD